MCCPRLAVNLTHSPVCFSHKTWYTVCWPLCTFDWLIVWLFGRHSCCAYLLWQTVTKLLHRKSPSPLPSSTPGISLADNFASFFTDNFVCPLIATTPRHLLTHLLLLQHLISPLSTLLLNLKSTRYYQTALISSPIPIPSPPGFSKNAHLCWSPQSLILSVFHSLPFSSTPFSKNLLFLHSSRNPP